MKKRSILILSATITIAAISAFGLTDQIPNNSIKENNSEPDSANVPLSEFGINGGINIDVRTGKKIEFVADKSKSELIYTVRGYSNRGFHKSITRQKLINAKTISDIIENYPDNWIKDYNSVSISGIGKDINLEAVGKNATLTTEQKELLAKAYEIHIAVHYQKENHENLIQNRQMNTSFVVIPETQAEYSGGHDKMIAYLKENSLQEIKAKKLMLPQPTIYFVVDENGNVEDPELTQTSGDENIDKMLLKMVKEMPQWIPAKNAEGVVVKQKFAFDIGMDGC